ncbi:diguanylate cyclase domain-containing protein [Variovorax sp. PvP013]|uniref:diguanylate cyclase domain-containing protein n=1 Tax=Variovorax sp. PvP013 TaxID=3156435 RepID=UPI003D1F7BA8
MPSRSLHARFRTVVFGISALLAAAVATVVYHSARSHYMQTGETSVRAIVAAVEQTVAVGAYARDDVLLRELVEGLAHHPSVSRVSVLDGVGQSMAAADGAANAGDAATIARAAGAPSFESTLASPFNPAETVGRLRVWLDTTRLAAEARRQASLLVAALIVLLAGVLAVFNVLASRLLSRPMHRLAAALERLEPGTSERLAIAPRHAHDEVGIVTAAANRLLELQQQALERERAMRDEIAALEARYRGIFDSTSAGIFILSEAGELLQANPALSRLLGLPADQLEPGRMNDFAGTVFVLPSRLSRLVEQARASAQPEAADLELVRGDGSTLWAHCMVSVLTDAARGAQRVEGVLYDITQRKVQEHAAQHRAEHDALTGLKSRAFIESSLGQHVYTARRDEGAVTLMFIDLDGFKGVNDRWGHAAGDAVLVEAAQRLRTLFHRPCDIVGRLGGDELVVMIVGVEATDPSVGELAGRLIESFRIAFALPNGEHARVGASVGVASYPLHAANSKTLIHAADAAMYAVKQSGKGGFVIAETGGAASVAAPPSQAGAPVPPTAPGRQRDVLTGLCDRRELVEQLAASHARVLAGADPVAVICLDIDQFKLLNVAHGAHIGDEVLCEVARRFQAVLRREDVIARTGGDEFVALVASDGKGEDAARRVAEGVSQKLLGSLSEPFHLSTCTLAIHASAGASLIDARTVDGLVVLREAQLALRRSKTVGRSGLVVFEQAMMAGFHDRLALEEDLRGAIGSPQLFLHVQPQVDRWGAVIGGEALLRWRHPERGLVPPDQFIPLAESCGAIVELGIWVLHAGCRILVDLRRRGGAQTLAINISPVQFNHPDFVAQVREALSSNQAPADGLILEITEGLLITDVAHVTERLRELVALGVRFSIDDFGTGFSSLGYLRQLPLREIKIDRSFIVGLPNDVASAGIVCSILSMGSHLGLHVVAEGVETPEQAMFLAQHGCPSQQGWLHGRPMAPEAFLRSCHAHAPKPAQSAGAPTAEAVLGA